MNLSESHNVILKLYKNLEHCFVNSKDAEMNTFSQVDLEVIKDISDWILTL